MTPFSELARRLSGSLEEAGYQPLDIWREAIGGDRHGVFDYTWVEPYGDGRHCYASLYIARSAERFPWYWAEVWGAVEKGPASPRSLVAHFELLDTDRGPEVELQLQVSMIEAARRAELMRLADAPGSSTGESKQPAWTGIERAPYRLTVTATAALFERQPERRWRNREVLEALLELDFRTDRAAVNAALSDLVDRGAIRRIQRGLYTANR